MPNRRVAAIVTATIVVAAVAIIAAASFWWCRAAPASGAAAPVLSYAELTGSVFEIADFDRIRAPRVRELALPDTHDATAIWGATGRDARGHVWVGISVTHNGLGAHLLEFDPAKGTWRDHGSVVEQLKRAGLHRDGKGQVKIHSKIVQGADGWLYFASSDEEGESESGALPRWGGNLWRIDPVRGTWEHKLATPEGLVAVSGVGRYVYALGYWGHVLYQYDTLRGGHRRVVVGSVAGHVSRNFVADNRGHAYVPRVRTVDGQPTAELVEFDSELRQVAATPLEFYLDKGSPNGNHGITGLAYLPDGRMLFTTGRGHLYAIEPQSATPARVRALGWFHPEGEAYAPSLFVWGGANWLAGVTLRKGRYEWVTHELRTSLSHATPLDTGTLKGVLLYGSVTRDDQGRAYLGGWKSKDARGSGMRPVLLQVEGAR